MRLKLFILGLLCSLGFASCNKDEEVTFHPNATLTYSTDSVLFDTVFTSIGSSTRRLKIFNDNSQAINIENIKLSGGNNSSFSININGIATNEINQLKINGNDSINVFVKVLINPTLQNLPFIVEDSLLLQFNGKKRKIPLLAYGQNAVFVNNTTINTNTIWNSKLPYLIYKSVTVAKDVNLSIEPGARILFHGNANMAIKGTLTANGTKTDSILFASDRLEKTYQNESGQWNGLHFYSDSKNSKINYAIIKNAIAGVTVDSLSINSNPKLLLTNTVIKNMEVVGLLGYQTEITAYNNLFFNCGQYLLYGAGGGNYDLKQNTFVGFNPNFARKTAAVYLSDFISSSQSANLKVDLYNNIIWGNLKDELLIEKKAATLTTTIKNNLLKSNNPNYAKDGNILNVDPLFVNPEKFHFNLSKNSFVINRGFDLSGFPNFGTYLNRDLNAKERLFPSEIGCYEQ